MKEVAENPIKQSRQQLITMYLYEEVFKLWYVSNGLNDLMC